MRRLACAALVAVFALSALSSTARAEVNEDTFMIDTMGDLTALCGVEANDPNAVAAIHMCHGYLTGLVHFHMVMGRALEGHIFCMKEEARPTRDQAVAMLVEWSRANPQHNGLEAVDGVLAWLAETYPCSG